MKQFLLIRKIAEKSQIVDKSYSSGNYAAELRQRPGPRRGAGRCWSEKEAADRGSAQEQHVY